MCSENMEKQVQLCFIPLHPKRSRCSCTAAGTSQVCKTIVLWPPAYHQPSAILKRGMHRKGPIDTLSHTHNRFRQDTTSGQQASKCSYLLTSKSFATHIVFLLILRVGQIIHNKLCMCIFHSQATPATTEILDTQAPLELLAASAPRGFLGHQGLVVAVEPVSQAHQDLLVFQVSSEIQDPLDP